MPDPRVWDAVVVGGGPAGLSAALTLGRCRRRVLVVDAGRQRNRFSHGMHAFLSRDGIPPAEFLAVAREQLARYDGVELRGGEVVDARRIEDGFEVRTADGHAERGRVLLLATGVVDELPRIAGIEAMYGRSVHHCPYCDGWEWRDRAIGVYGRGSKGSGLALMLKQWSADVVLFTDGPARLERRERERIERHGIAVRSERIVRLEGEDGMLRRVVLAKGEPVERAALFFNTGQHQRSPLAAQLGCRFTHRGGVKTHAFHVATNVAGLYVAGDASRDVQLVAIAAAEGVEAGFAINRELLRRQGLLG